MSWEEVQNEINSGTGEFFKPNNLPLNEPVEITVIGYMKWTQTKFPIQGKNYTWRFKLADGRVMDVSNANRKILLQGMHPNNQKEAVPARFRITNIGKVINKQPTWRVEYLGKAQAPTAEDDTPPELEV